ncbi:ATP-binding protein [Reichenbachiella agarivorans]|uniref:histidine kinase n=1 Tax=Reichenbachiella agarivorans TaxID=2979464 RepID=A0ABY6CN77_9BACT|nr:ATP-binding protein [Reichenbachiella agarivorans]UXP31970.1 ATP-binding protein [Reichenbachiella agarivorans]
MLLIPWLVNGQSWRNAQINKKAQLDLLWFTSVPFIYADPSGKMVGVECEIMEAFKIYLNDKYQVDLKLNWVETNNFYRIIERVRDSSQPQFIGVSALSITDERKDFLKFTEPYLPDITVLVSSKGTPIVHGYDQIYDMMISMKAVTIKGTSYENMLIDLRNQLGVEFEIIFIESDRNILDVINQSTDRFGFIDLPIYLMLIKRGEVLTRQNFFTTKGKGYSFIMPPSSDWDIPFNEFMSDPDVKMEIAQIVSEYMGPELFEFMDHVDEHEQLSTSILTKEKEMQLALIQNANLKLEEEKEYKRMLVFGIVIIGLFLLVIAVLFFNNQRTTKILIEQKAQIEEQQSDIRQKNEQLLNRNIQLLALNEEKNNLVNILAHDLRSPLNHIVGLSNLLEDAKTEMSEDERSFLNLINDAAAKMHQMVNKILDVDALERNQSTLLREKVDIRSTMNDVASRYRPAATQKAIDFKVNLPSSHYNLVTDHMLLFLVLENLISNAIKFSPPDSEVILETKYENETIIFVVKDNGPGFSEEDKELMFHRFQKLSATPTGGESSTGLGLSIVKKYVSDLGGKIWLESTHGEGSTFFVSLPQ